ncbi:hypothetical protein B7494_g3228 [Chlorociboria aeruginascens]|nr:hypothetical protein B7494_g3228 [Chlorociboria aeruginascens]
MPALLTTAPVLSTPESHVFESSLPTPSRSSDIDLLSIYEIPRTAREILAGGWQRIALQFPDGMLGDAGRVYDLLSEELDSGDGEHKGEREKSRLFILGDTSYGACCVDEIAAEHGDAEVVVHYGRACLSPTARLPVLYIYTIQPLDLDAAVTAFVNTVPGRHEKVVLMADLEFHSHIQILGSRIKALGYPNLLIPDIIRDPDAGIPNRDAGLEVQVLKLYSIFHISSPPTSLLLTLSSRVHNLYIYNPSSAPPTAQPSNTTPALRRRYALLTSLSTCGVWGILINTLSVKNYLTTVSQLRELLARHGRKSYVFVVGKINVPKLANFEEIGGWVVVGCWESSVVEGEGFYRPCVTPFEMGLLLSGGAARVWGGEWCASAGIATLSLDAHESDSEESMNNNSTNKNNNNNNNKNQHIDIDNNSDSDPDSTPPDFDLRTGKYVSHSRPLLSLASPRPASTSSHALARSQNQSMLAVNGVPSPGAEFLRGRRWMGLGSDFMDGEGGEDGGERGAVVEQGLSGVARGYVVGDGDGDEKERR